MIKKPELKRFLKQHLIADFDKFYLHKDEMLIRISSIFVHGFFFQRSRVSNDIYVQPFIDFLTDGKDFTGFTIGVRVRRVDVTTFHRDFFDLQPPDAAADLIVKSIRASEYYPFVIRPTCRSLLDSFAGKLDSVWALFGLGCCAIMEDRREQATHLLRQFDDIVTQFHNDNAITSHVLYESISQRLNNLVQCREFLWKQCEATIRLRNLKRIAELSGWKPG